MTRKRKAEQGRSPAELLLLDRVIATITELHRDHWPREIRFVVERIEAGNPWFEVKPGALDPSHSASKPIDRPYLTSHPLFYYPELHAAVLDAA